MRATLLLFVAAAALVASPVASDLVMCDACVAVTTEMCTASLKHNKVLGEAGDKTKSKKFPAGKAMTPMSVVMAETMADACHIDRLRKYSHPPPVLTPKCNAFLAKYEDEVDAFFETFHRKDEEELKCRVAIDLLCNDVTEVCKDYDHEAIDRGGVQTYEFREKGTAPSKDGMKTWGGPKGGIPKGMKDFAKKAGGVPPSGKKTETKKKAKKKDEL